MDFSKPVTPGDAVRYSSDDVNFRAQELRAEAARMVYAAEQLERVADRILSNAEWFDQYQPAPEAHE